LRQERKKENAIKVGERGGGGGGRWRLLLQVLLLLLNMLSEHVGTKKKKKNTLGRLQTTAGAAAAAASSNRVTDFDLTWVFPTGDTYKLSAATDSASAVRSQHNTIHNNLCI